MTYKRLAASIASIAFSSTPAWIGRIFNVPSDFETAKWWWPKLLWMLHQGYLAPVIGIGLLTWALWPELSKRLGADRMPLVLGFDQKDPACVRDISEKWSSNMSRLIDGKQLFVQLRNLDSKRIEAVSMRMEGTNPRPYPGKNPAQVATMVAPDKAEAGATDYVPVASVFLQQERGARSLSLNTDSSPSHQIINTMTCSMTLRVSVENASKRWEFMIHVVGDEIRGKLIGRNE